MLCSVVQSCSTLCDPMDYKTWRYSVHGIFQARIPELFAISFPRRSSGPGIKPAFLVSLELSLRQILYPLNQSGNPYCSIYANICNVTHHINKLKDQNHMIISIDVKKKNFLIKFDIHLCYKKQLSR